MVSLYPEPDNITNVSSALTHVNIISDGAFTLGIPISLFVIVLIIGIVSKGKTSIVFTTASVLFFITSTLLAWGQYLNPLIPIMGAIFSGLGAMWVGIENSN